MQRNFLRPVRVDGVRLLHMNWAHRRIPLSRGSHVIGRLAPRVGHPVVGYESLVERRALCALASRTECLELWTQPFTMTYLYDGKEVRYTPDILALFKPVPHDLLCQGFAKHTAIEVKPDDRAPQWRDRLMVHREIMQDVLAIPLVMIGEQAIAQLAAERAP